MAPQEGKNCFSLLTGLLLFARADSPRDPPHLSCPETLQRPARWDHNGPLNARSVAVAADGRGGIIIEGVGRNRIDLLLKLTHFPPLPSKPIPKLSFWFCCQGISLFAPPRSSLESTEENFSFFFFLISSVSRWRVSKDRRHGCAIPLKKNR